MKTNLVRVVVVALGLSSGGVMAASISNLNGQSCPDGFIGNWHFINNKTGGAPDGVLQATWDSGNLCQTGPEKTLASVQHFRCFATGTLTSAVTNLPGRLVLSDFTCTDVKDPPPCDPKIEICK